MSTIFSLLTSKQGIAMNLCLSWDTQWWTDLPEMSKKTLTSQNKQQTNKHSQKPSAPQIKSNMSQTEQNHDHNHNLTAASRSQGNLSLSSGALLPERLGFVITILPIFSFAFSHFFSFDGNKILETLDRCLNLVSLFLRLLQTLPLAAKL